MTNNPSLDYYKFVPYDTYAKIISMTQERVTQEFAPLPWSPVLLIQPATNTTVVAAAAILRSGAPWKKGVRVQLKDPTAASTVVDTIMDPTTKPEDRVIARMQWSKMCHDTAEMDKYVEQMRNPDYKTPSEQSRIILA